ncbi:MAG: flavodoxin family protein [Dehalococcoidia bacterium]|nr:flavodoxin family protein [Dehalococcoidia bacterium]
MEINILGISGSPRHANTERLVEESLKAAGELNGVKTKLISLADYDLQPCDGCGLCRGDVKGSTEDVVCYNHQDADPIIKEIMKADGLIIGSPVYTWNVSARLKCLLEKCAPLCPYPMTEISYRLRNKVLGAIAVAGGIWEGQEVVTQTLWRWGLSLGMIIAGATSTEYLPTSCLVAGMASGAFSPSVSAFDSVSRDVNPVLGRAQMTSTRNLGRNVATISRIVKYGLKGLEDSGEKIPGIATYRRSMEKPAPGSYLERMVKEGKITLVEPKA